MTWFKVDDKFHGHRKVRRLGSRPTTVPLKVAVVGLWVLAGSWSADQPTDGFVPVEVLQGWDPAEELAQQLVQVGLWHTAEQDGERGYRFHDWEHYNPLLAEVLAMREQRAAAGRAGGLASARTRRKNTQANAEAGAEAVLQGASRGTSRSGQNRPSNRSGNRQANAEAGTEAGAVAGASRKTFPQVNALTSEASAEASASANAVAGAEAKTKQKRTPSRPDPYPSSSSSSAVENIVAEALELNPEDDDEDEEIKKVIDLILRENQPTAPARYIRTLADNGDLHSYLARIRRNEPDPDTYTGPTHPFEPSGSPDNPSCIRPGCGLHERNRVHAGNPA